MINHAKKQDDRQIIIVVWKEGPDRKINTGNKRGFGLKLTPIHSVSGL